MVHAGKMRLHNFFMMVTSFVVLEKTECLPLLLHI